MLTSPDGALVHIADTELFPYRLRAVHAPEGGIGLGEPSRPSPAPTFPERALHAWLRAALALVHD